MKWKTLRAAITLALRYSQYGARFIFSGGEPLLEFDLIRKAVAYANTRLPRKKNVLFAVITNGTLLTDDKIRFLASYSIATNVSFDGVRAAQDLRGAGTFARLDRLLSRLQRKYPDFYASNVRIAMTVVPETVRHAGDSFAYFLEKGARQIAISPSFTDSSCCKPGYIRQFEEQFAKIYKASLAHFDRTGDVPLLLFQPTEDQEVMSEETLPPPHQCDGVSDELGDGCKGAATKLRGSSTKDSPGSQDHIEGQHRCAVARGDALAVDVNGQVYPCAVFANSYQELTSSAFNEAVRATCLGSITGHQFWKRYDRLPEVTRRLVIFTPRERRYSSYRLCRDCPYFAQCSVCPVSAVYLRGNESCERIPDFICAFAFTALKYQERFSEQISSRTNRPRAFL